MRYVYYFPLLALVLIAYNVAMVSGVDFEANSALFHIPHMTRDAPIAIGAADVLLGAAIVLLFFEILKSTRSSRMAAVDHMLSVLVFIVFLVELLVVAGAGTAAFVLCTLISLIDVIAGFTVSIATARRDLAIGDGLS